MNRMIATLMTVGLSIANLAAQPVNFDGGRSANLAIKTIVSNLKASAQSIQAPAPQSVIVIPPPAGTIQYVDPQTMSHLLTLAQRIATTTSGASYSSGNSTHELYACASPQGNFVFSDPTTMARLTNLADNGDNSVVTQVLKQMEQYNAFSFSSFSLDANMDFYPDGTQTLKSITVQETKPLTILPSGKIIYTDPIQLSANWQAQLKKALAFWAKVPPEAITTDALYGNLLNKDFTCAP